MPMRITRLAAAELFEAAGHSGVQPVRMQGGTETPTDGVTVIVSHYLPGGEAERSVQPAETIYVVTAGELVFASEDIEATLVPMDSAHFTMGTPRTVHNRSNLPASMLVIRTKK